MSVDKPASDWAASRFSECLQQVSCSCSHTMQCTEAAPILPIIAPKGLNRLMCGALRLQQQKFHAFCAIRNSPCYNVEGVVHYANLATPGCLNV